MKILLIQDVHALGSAGQIKEVPDGYARNFLLPRGMAVAATPGEMKKREVAKRQQAILEAKQADANQRLAARITSTQLLFKAKVGEQHRLFGSITASDIADSLERELGREIDRHRLVLEEPIKHLGTFKVPVHLARDLSPELTVVVEAEQ